MRSTFRLLCCDSHWAGLVWDLGPPGLQKNRILENIGVLIFEIVESIFKDSGWWCISTLRSWVDTIPKNCNQELWLHCQLYCKKSCPIWLEDDADEADIKKAGASKIDSLDFEWCTLVSQLLHSCTWHGHASIVKVCQFEEYSNLWETASEKVYRKLSIKYHPDKNPDEESKRTSEVCGSSSPFFARFELRTRKFGEVRDAYEDRMISVILCHTCSDVYLQQFNKYSKKIIPQEIVVI